VVPSLLRWGRRDAFGGALVAAVDDIRAETDRVVAIRLKRPFPLLADALGKSGVNMPCIMPERLARTDAMSKVTDPTGSGPYRFVPGEWVPGAQVVYQKFDGYVPRPDGTPSLTAGPRTRGETSASTACASHFCVMAVPGLVWGFLCQAVFASLAVYRATFSSSLLGGRNACPGSVSPEATRWLDGDDLVQIEIDDRLEGFASGSIVRGFGQGFEPTRVLSVQRDEFGDSGIPALQSCAPAWLEPCGCLRGTGGGRIIMPLPIARLAFGTGQCLRSLWFACHVWAPWHSVT
jgi:hypothetical protein